MQNTKYCGRSNELLSFGLQFTIQMCTEESGRTQQRSQQQKETDLKKLSPISFAYFIIQPITCLNRVE